MGRNPFSGFSLGQQFLISCASLACSVPGGERLLHFLHLASSPCRCFLSSGVFSTGDAATASFHRLLPSQRLHVCFLVSAIFHIKVLRIETPFLMFPVGFLAPSTVPGTELVFSKYLWNELMKSMNLAMFNFVLIFFLSWF